MKQHYKVLFIEDVPKYADLMREILQGTNGSDFEIEWAETLAAGVKLLSKQDFDVVLLDLAIPDSQGLEGFIRAHQAFPLVPFIVLSSVDDETVGVRAVHEGAQDYLVKGEINPHLLIKSIRYAVERNSAEMALLHAEEKYRGIFENTIEGIFQTTPEGRYLSANRALARIYGYATPEDLIEGLRDIGRELYVLPGRREEFIRLMDLNDVVPDFQSQIYRKDQSIIWISENVRAVRDSNHHLLYYEGTVEDITSRKEAEERLYNSETLYHSLVETLPQNIFRKNLAEQFTFANRRFCQTLNLPLDQIIGKTDFDFFPPSLAAQYQKDDQTIMQTGKSLEIIEENVPPNGEKLYVNVVKTPLYDSKGQIIGLQGIFWDITARKKAEEAARLANAALEVSREELRVKNEQLEDDLRMAREIQQAIIPSQYPMFPRSATPDTSTLRFCHRYLPTGAVGGDFFNILALSDTKAGVFICDVMGHGVRSALVVAIVRALVEELTRVAADPGELLAHMNRDLRAILRNSRNPMFTTAFYLVVDVEKNEICYANAGHPKPLLIRPGGGSEFLGTDHRRKNPGLGLFDEAIYTVSKTSFQHGDTLMLFTDGLFDVEGDDEPLSPEWLRLQVEKRAQMPLNEIFDNVLAEVKIATGGAEFVDDVCLVGVRAGALPTEKPPVKDK
jgi:sigma-B regulation protein RsbU (phosphoserine phosphatase)